MESKGTDADMWELVKAVFKLLLVFFGVFFFSKLDNKVIS